MRIGRFFIHRKWQIDAPGEKPILVIHRNYSGGQRRLLWIRFPKFMRARFNQPAGGR